MTEEIVAFKKSKLKGKKLRQVEKTIDTEDGDVKTDQFEEVRLLQKRRVRNKGVTAAVDDVGASGGNTAADGAGEQKIMGQSFQQQEQNVNPMQSHMDKYISDQLAARRQGKKQEVKPKERDPYDDTILYETPDILKNAKPQEELVESGDRWLTGIAEVPLPISDKLKTIEETEKAKEKLFAARAASNGAGVALSMPANFNADYSRHQKEYAEKRKEQFKANAHATAQQPDARDTAPNANPRKRTNDAVATASDDRVVAQFLKKYRW
jgi:hypothetical protein